MDLERDKKIKTLLTKNVVEIIEKEHLENKLKSGKKLRIKLGIDPTGPKIHLGRVIALWKLKEFQDLDHQIVLIIGDFTGLVGDASDKASARPALNEGQIKINMADYSKQISKILNMEKVELRYNSDWLSKLTLKEIIKLASLFTVHQLINRRNFKERFDAEQQIGLNEFLYPLLQGYDSVAIGADIEIGGTDQLFNLKAGRKIQEFHNQEPQDIMTLEMLVGTDGQKMSTSLGNVINIADEPNEMYGKIMSMRDELVVEYFARCTDLDEKKIKEIKEGFKNKTVDPFQAKSDLAFEIVDLYHGKMVAEKAKDYFIKTFQKKELPKDVPEIRLQKEKELADILIENNFINSKSSFRRLIKEKAIEVDGTIVDDIHCLIKKPSIIRVGKRKFLKLSF